MKTNFMKTFSRVIFVCLWISVSSVYAQQTGKYNTTILFNGSGRTLAYYVPSSYNPVNKYPLIVGLHFCGGSAEGYRDVLMPLADSVNAILVCPEGPVTDQMTGAESLIIPLTIDTVAALYSIDTTQVVLTGFSCNGQVTFEYGLKKIYPFKGIIPYDPYIENPRDERYDLDSDMPVSICVTSNDLTYANTLLLYDRMLENGANVTINIMKPVGHTYDFPEFTAEMLECYRLLNQDRNLRFKSPESVVYDTITGSYLVSTAYDKRIIRTDGNPLSNQIFVDSNLVMPLGMTIIDSIVYVADSSHVKGFHVKTAEMIFDLAIAGAILCNGITSDKDSILFVSDYSGNKIYRINVLNSEVHPILADYTFSSPNGVEFDSETQTLMIVCSGNGELVKADLARPSTVSKFSTGLGGLDGLAMDKFGNIYVSSWAMGSVNRIEKDLTKVVIASGLKGPADIYVNDLSGMLMIPDMERNLLKQVDIYPFMDAVMFGGNAQHYRASSSKTCVTKNPEVKWTFKTDGPVVSSPVLFGNTLYVGSNDSCLYAVDTLGNFKWKFRTDGIVTSSPAVYCSRVYFTSFDGKLYCLDADSGTKKWEFATLGERLYETDNYCGISHSRDAFDFFLSSPAIYRENVYFGSGDGNLYAVDAATGVKKWSYQTGDVVHTSPAIANNLVYFGSWDRYFYALDAISGDLKWKVETGDDQASHCMMGIQSSALIASNAVYFGCRDAKVYSLKALTGEENWKYSNPGNPWVLTTPAYYAGKVYFGTSDSRAFTALKADGSLLFSKNYLAYIYSSPAVWTSYGYFGTCGGRLFCADLKTGDLVWEFKTEGAKADPDDMLNDNGTIKVPVDMSSESAMFAWMNKLYRSGIVISSPVVGNGALYFGSTDGYLYALKEGADTASSAKSLTAERCFTISPNPCSNYFTVPSVWKGKQIKKIEIYTLLGELLLSKDLSVRGASAVVFSTGDLKKGICLVTATLDDGRPVTGKLVIE
jgi:outer membrane protein assembly factor BamB